VVSHLPFLPNLSFTSLLPLVVTQVRLAWSARLIWLLTLTADLHFVVAIVGIPMNLVTCKCLSQVEILWEKYKTSRFPSRCIVLAFSLLLANVQFGYRGCPGRCKLNVKNQDCWSVFVLCHDRALWSLSFFRLYLSVRSGLITWMVDPQF
jgi:hypothetical protein